MSWSALRKLVEEQSTCLRKQLLAWLTGRHLEDTVENQD